MKKGKNYPGKSHKKAAIGIAVSLAVITVAAGVAFAMAARKKAA